MRSSPFLLAFLGAYSCTATEHWQPKGDAEVKTTLLTLTKPPCSSSTTSVVVAQNTYVPVSWPAKEVYAPPVVKHETWTPPPAEVKSTAAVWYTPKVEDYTSSETTTSSSSEAAYTPPPVKYESSSSAPPVEQKNTEMKHETVYEASTSTTPSYVPPTVESTYTPPVKQDTTPVYVPPTTTEIKMQHQTITSTTTITYSPPPPAETATTNAAKTYTLVPTPATCLCPPTTATPTPTLAPPKFPLKPQELKAIDSLLSLLLSIPDAILSSGNDASISNFYMNLSTCVGSKGATLKQSFLEFGDVFDDLGSDIEKGVKEAGDFLSGLAGDAGDAVEDKLPEVTKIAGDIVSEITAAPSKLLDAVGPVISNIFNLDVQSIDSISTVSKRETPPIFSSIGDIVSGIDALRACLTSAVATNPLFEVAKCAASIAGVFPVGRALKARGLIAGLGGRVKVLTELGRAKDVAGVGREVLDLVGELSGVADVVKDCKFLVD